MKLLEATNIESMRISDNVPVDSCRAYDSTRNYRAREMVRYGDYAYTSVDDDNQGNDPESSPLKWDFASRRVVNGKAYLHTDTSLQSVNTKILESMIFEYDFSGHTSLLLTGIVGSNVNIKVVDKTDETIVHSNEDILLVATENDMDWYTWIYPSLQPKMYQNKIYREFDRYYNSKVIVTISPDVERGGTALGNLVIGSPIEIGCTLRNIKRGLKSNSKMEIKNGVNVVSERQGYNRLDADVYVESGRESSVYSILEEYIDSPVVVIADDNELGTIFGIFRDIEMSIDYSSTYTLSVDSLETIRSKREIVKMPHGGDFTISTVDDWNYFFNQQNNNPIEFTTGKGFGYFNKFDKWISSRIKYFDSVEFELTTDSSLQNTDKANITITFDTGEAGIVLYQDNTVNPSQPYQRLLYVGGNAQATKDTLYTSKWSVKQKDIGGKEIQTVYWQGNKYDASNNQTVHQYINNITFKEIVWR